MPVIIDPRRHDAVLFDLETDLDSTLAARLRDVGWAPPSSPRTARRGRPRT